MVSQYAGGNSREKLSMPFNLPSSCINPTTGSQPTAKRPFHSSLSSSDFYGAAPLRYSEINKPKMSPRPVSQDMSLLHHHDTFNKNPSGYDDTDDARLKNVDAYKNVNNVYFRSKLSPLGNPKQSMHHEHPTPSVSTPTSRFYTNLSEPLDVRPEASSAEASSSPTSAKALTVSDNEDDEGGVKSSCYSSPQSPSSTLNFLKLFKSKNQQDVTRSDKRSATPSNSSIHSSYNSVVSDTTINNRADTNSPHPPKSFFKAFGKLKTGSRNVAQNLKTYLKGTNYDDLARRPLQKSASYGTSVNVFTEVVENKGRHIDI